MRICLAPLAIAGATCVSVAAPTPTPIPVANHSFEADFAPDGSFPVGPVTDWPAYDPGNLLSQGGNFTGVLNPTGTACFNFMDAPDGRNWVLLFLQGSIGQGPVGVRQFLGEGPEAYTRYTLTVEVGNINSCAGLPPFDQFFELEGFPGYSVELWSGNQLLAQDLDLLVMGEGESSTSVIHAEITDAVPPDPFEIRLINLNEEDTPMDPGIEVDFDNVRLTAVPFDCGLIDITVDGACDIAARGDGLITLSDFSCYLSLWAASDPFADITTTGACDLGTGDEVVDLSDFSCYLAEWAGGCFP